MKKIYLIILTSAILILVLSANKVNIASISFPLAGKVIYIDAGHGGVDKGTSFKNINEKDINLQITKELSKVLKDNGATVYLTRENDNDIANKNAMYRKKSDFDNRIKLINNSNADMYISIHQNHYKNSKYYGPQVFYVKDNKDLAQTLQDELNIFTNTNRKIKTIENTYMYNKLNKKGILIECGFLSNEEERKKLINKDYQKELSISITNGIINYFQKK